MYQSFFHLTGKPFRLSPDPGFFFPSRGHKRALAYLRYGLNQDEGFVVITGAPGTGKTTLAKILLQEMGDKNVVVAHLTTTQLDADDMLRMVAASFGLRYEGLDKAALLKALEAFLMARARERKRALLVIDEAQNLPARSLEELRMLSNLQSGDKALVQTFLLGQAQFRQMLDNPDLEQLRQRVIANYHLSPLAQDECQRYIESRMQQVGWTNDPHFAEIAYEMIHEYTEGIPRRINMLCDRVLLYSCMEDLHEITAEVIKMVTKELDQELSGTPIDAADDEALEYQQTTNEAAAERWVQHAERTKQAPIYVEEKEDSIERSVQKNSEPNDSSAEQEPKVDESRVTGERSIIEREVVGNTVTSKPKPSPDKDESSPSSSSADISDRDLLRVIPGGRKTQDGGSVDKSGAGRLAPAAQAKPSAEDVVQRRILRLVLAYHRSPSRFPGLDNVDQPLPDGITELLELAVSDDQVLNRVSPAAVMGISPVMLRAAVRFFIRRALFVVDGDDYRVLGLQPKSPQALVEKHYDLLMRLLRQDKQRGSADSVTRVGQAYEALSQLDQAKHANSRFQTKAAPNTSVIQINDEDDSGSELTIDFDVINKQAPIPPPSPFVNKPNEIFIPKSGFAFKRMRYAGQFAVLGFGALVIILGLYIVQMGPSDETRGKQRLAQQSLKERPLNVPEDQVIGSKATDSATPKSASADDVAKFANQQSEAAKSNQTQAQYADLGQDEGTVPAKELSAPELKREEIAQIDPDLASEFNVPTANRKNEQAEDPSPKPAKQQIIEKPTAKKAVEKVKLTPPSKPKATVVAKATVPEKSERQPAMPSVREEQTVTAPQSQQFDGKDIAFQDNESLTDDKNTTNNGRRLTTVTKPSIVPKQEAVSNLATTSPASEPVIPISQPQKTATPTQINTSDLDKILNRFAQAYANGDADEIMGVFTPDARTNNQATTSGIRKDYEDLFKTSSKRVMTIKTIRWEQEQDFARGVGTYQAQINPAGGNNSQIYSGELTLQVQKVGNNLGISRFYFTNKDTKDAARLPENAAPVPSTVAITTVATAPLPTTAGQASERSLPTASELQALVSRFLDAYQRGDIVKLMSLFADEAKSNDQPTKAGIRKDHVDLFTTTKVRKMTVNNFIWANEADRANGVGDFQVMVQPNNSDKFTTVQGKLRIIAKKTPSGVLITHLLHTVQ